MKERGGVISYHNKDIVSKILGEHFKNKSLKVYGIRLPLSVKGKEEKIRLLEEMINLAERITDQETQSFLLSGILVFSDKIIDDSNRKRIERSLRMTRIGKAIFEEGREEGRQLGQISLLYQLYKDQLLPLEEALKRTGLKEEEFLLRGKECCGK